MSQETPPLGCRPDLLREERELRAERRKLAPVTTPISAIAKAGQRAEYPNPPPASVFCVAEGIRSGAWSRTEQRRFDFLNRYRRAARRSPMPAPPPVLKVDIALIDKACVFRVVGELDI